MRHNYARTTRFRPSGKPIYTGAKQLRAALALAEVLGEQPPEDSNYLAPVDPVEHGGYAAVNGRGAVGPFIWYENARAFAARMGGQVKRWRDVKDTLPTRRP